MVTVYSIVNGQMMDLEVSLDDVVASGQLGLGCVFESDDGHIYSPVDGKVIMLFDQLHAIGIEDIDGNQYLIHIGYDLAKNHGEGLVAFVKLHDLVRTHQLLISLDKSILLKKTSSLHILFVIAKAKSRISFLHKSKTVSVSSTTEIIHLID